MKKITLLLLTFLFSLFGYAQNEDFEAGIPATWTIMNGTNGLGNTQKWMLNTTLNPQFPSGFEAHSGLNAAFINFEQIGANNTEEDWLIMDSRVVPANGQLRFWTRQTLTGDQGTIYQIRVSNNANVTNHASYAIVQSWTESDLQDLNGDIEEYVEKTVDFPPQYIGQPVFIAFVRTFTQPLPQRGGDRWLVDDVKIRPKCLSPNGLDFVSAESTTVQLRWNNPGLATNFEIEIIPADQEPTGSGFLVTAPGTNPTTYTTTLTDIVLQPNTAYRYYVRAICGSPDDIITSDWGGPFPFTTLPLGSKCANPLVVNGLPFQSLGNTAAFGDYFDGNQGTQCNTTPPATNYLQGNEVFYSYTPTVDGLVSFTMTPSGTPATNSSLFVFAGCANIGVTCLGGMANAAATPRIVTLNLTAGITYIVVISSSSGNQTVAYDLVIQNENCTPKPVDKPTTSITTTSALLEWENPNNFEAWEIAIQTLGQTVPTTAGTLITQNPYNAENLESGTRYQYWVRAECVTGSGIFTAWAGPFLFTTEICEPENKCTHTFIMTDSANNGWNGARMQIRQNNIVLATIGTDFNSGGGPIPLSLQLCKNVPFDVFWITPGTAPQQCILNVVNSFGQTIFSKPAGVGTPGGVIYSNTVNCDTPRCDIPPTNVQAPIATINTTSATISWSSPATSSWDIYVVPTGDPAPTADTTPTYNDIIVADVNNPSYVITDLIPDHSYDVYIRVNCDTPGPSGWSTPKTFTTLPTCPKPTNLEVIDTTTTSATLKWVNGTPADTLWEILLVPSPTMIPPTAPPALDPVIGPGTIFFQTTQASPHILPLNTLTPATIYFYYIRTICPGDDKSTWSGPIVFHTVTCEPENKCSYKFVLTDAGGNGWNNARVQVRQNGILIATLGPTIANGSGPVTVPVSLCTNVPFDLYWSVAGTAPQEIGITIINPFTDIIFTKPPGTGNPLEVIYSSVANCTPPTCPKPTALSVNVLATTQTTAELSWTENALPLPGATQWEVYAVPVGTTPTVPPVNGTPVSGVAPYYIANSNPYTIEGLLPGTNYIFYVRSICSGTDISTWTILNPKTFTTKPVNDECSAAINVPTNPTRECAQSVTASTLGATRSLPNTLPVCQGATDDDVWFTFTATSTIHIITFSDIVGNTTDINHTLYSGSDCATMTQLYCSNPNVSVATGLVVGNIYKIRVYTNGAQLTQSARFKLCITTPPPVTNDECANAIVAQVNTGVECNVFTSASITGATASAQASSCPGTEDDDIWFTFTATAPIHLITLANIQGTNTNLVHSLYKGDDCGNLELEYCSDDEESLAEDLIVGTIYKIRVWSSVNTIQDITFDLCIGRILPPIIANTTQYSKKELIEDIFLKTTCANVTNITWSTGTDFGSTNGIGYFNRGESEFPYFDGIVLTTGDASKAPGPNLTNLSDGGGFDGTWTDPDPDLEAIVLEATGEAMNSKNVTKLEFDFTPLKPSIGFDFIFASEEYGDFQCAYSDTFAFLLTNIATGVTTNLAVLEGTNTPISVVTIRDAAFNTPGNDCESANETSFGQYYGDYPGINPIGAPINFDGMTIDLHTSADVIPFTQYHIKLVIADRSDTQYDSAIFLKGGSFDIGNVELGSDFLESEGNAICLGDTVPIDSGLDQTLYSFKWFNGTDEILGQTGPVLLVNAEGTYKLIAQYGTTDCYAEDTIIVEYFQDSVVGTPVDLIDCNASGTGNFDLTDNEGLILAPFVAGTHAPFYFLTEEDAVNNVIENAITGDDLLNFAGTNNQEIFVRVNKTGTTCHQIVSFKLIVQDLTPQFTFTGDMSICSEATTRIQVAATNGNFNEDTVGYTWFRGDDVIVGQTQKYLDISGPNYGIYYVEVDNTGCKNKVQFEITEANDVWNVSFENTPYVICKETIALSFTGIGFEVNNPDAVYTWTRPDGSTFVGPVLNANVPGDYDLNVNILGCDTDSTVSVTENKDVINVAFEFGCNENNEFVLTALPVNNSFDPVTAVYIWTSTSAFVATGPETPESIILKDKGEFNLIVRTIEGCEQPASQIINNVSCKIQKGISPNNDNENDSFDLGTIPVKQLTIYNRYGTEVYQRPNYTKEWFGQSSSGEELPDGTYFYVIDRGTGKNTTGWIYINR